MTILIQYLFHKYAHFCTESQFTKMTMVTLLENTFSAAKLSQYYLY